MKKFFGKIWKGSKVVLLPAATLGLSLAGQGVLGPKGVAIAAAATTLIGVFSRRPQDPHPSDKPKPPQDHIESDEDAE